MGTECQKGKHYARKPPHGYAALRIPGRHGDPSRRYQPRRLLHATGRLRVIRDRRIAERNAVPTDSLSDRFPREFRAWVNMLAKCYDPSHSEFSSAGGAGVKVAKQWRES